MGNPEQSTNVKYLRSREAARAAFFSARTAQRTVIKDFPLAIPAGDQGGKEVIIVTLQSPTVEERGDIFKKAGIGKSTTKGKGDARVVENATDLTAMQVEAILDCTFINENEDPNSKLVRFFTPEDRDGLLARNCGGIFDELSEACMSLVNVDEEEIRKNSKRTALFSGASSSPENSVVPSPK